DVLMYGEKMFTLIGFEGQVRLTLPPANANPFPRVMSSSLIDIGLGGSGKHLRTPRLPRYAPPKRAVLDMPILGNGRPGRPVRPGRPDIARQYHLQAFCVPANKRCSACGTRSRIGCSRSDIASISTASA